MSASGEFHLDAAGLSRQVQPLLIQRMRSLTRRIANQARQDVPVKTGNLGRSIREDPIKTVGPFRVEGGVTATAPYAVFVHNGTSRMKARPFLLNAAKRVASQES